MFDVIKGWFHRYFSDPEAVLLAAILIGGFFLIYSFSQVTAPLLASIIIAYFLQSGVKRLEEFRVPRNVGVFLVYAGFLSLFFIGFLVLWPIAWRQMVRLVEELPNMLEKTQSLLYLLPERFPEYISQEGIEGFTKNIKDQLSGFGRNAVQVTLSSIPNFIALMVYLILVPLMVFFFLKDHTKIIRWCTNFLPNKRPILNQVWEEVDDQIGNYVRGKVAEVFIIGLATFFVFSWLKMPYSILLSTLVGLSVLIPYVGATVVTIPVLLVAFFNWGIGPEFAWVAVCYFIIQILDGNVLVPLLFSEAVNLHPVAIVIAILFFGGVWGFWGIFFAIPLATLVKAVLNAWPKAKDQAMNQSLKHGDGVIG